MRYFEAFEARGFHSVFLTTFSFGSDAFEAMVLQRLRNAGCNNIHVLVDQTMLNQEFSVFGPPEHAGSLYHLVKCHRNGAFHPKIVVQLGEKEARLLVGSANLTGPGLAGNLEIISEVTCSGPEDASAPVIAEAMNYILRSHQTLDPWFEKGVQQALNRTPWLDLTQSAPVFQDAEFGPTALIHDGYNESPIDQYIGFIDDDPIKRLTIISPYWDKHLKALRELSSRLNAPKIRIAIQADRKLFPKRDADSILNIKLYELEDLLGSRRAHAKLYVAEGAEFDHVLSGSLNCSKPAMLTSRLTPLNAEAGIYRRLPKKTALKKMGLKGCFNSRVKIKDLPDYEVASGDTETLSAFRDGGALFLNAEKLFWHPPKNETTKIAKVLLGSDNMLEPDGLIRLIRDSEGDSWSGVVPAFLRAETSGIIIFDDGGKSSPVPICNMKVLPFKARPMAKKKVQNQLALLDTFEIEDLEIIDILYRLEKFEVEETLSRRSFSKPADRTTKEEGAVDYRPMTYQEFLSGRILGKQQTSGSGESVFSDRYVSEVSRALNRILGIVGSDATELMDEENSNFDPTEPNPDNIPDPDGLPGPPSSLSKKPVSLEKKTRWVVNRNTSDKVVSATGRLIERFSDKKRRATTLQELIHLRAMIQVILAFAIPAKNSKTSHRCLPPADASDTPAEWPRMIGRILVAFYGKGPDLLEGFLLPETTDAIPFEVVDFMASIEVAAHLAEQCASNFQETQFIAKHLSALTSKISLNAKMSIHKFPDSSTRHALIRVEMMKRFGHLVD